jgi:hypothetical protein
MAALGTGFKCFVSLVGVAALGSMVSCDKGDDKPKGSDGGGPGGGGAVQLNASLALNLAIANSYAPGSALALSDDAITPFEATSILSGPPEEMTISIKSMTLEGKTTEGADTILRIFEDASGRPVRIKGSKVDLSSLFEAFDCVGADGTKVTLAEGQTCDCGLGADGTVLQKVDQANTETGAIEQVCPLDQQLTAPVPLVPVSDGNYTKLSVEYSGTSIMKGCVSGYFRDSNTKTEADTRYTYCTKAGKSFFDTTVDAKAPEFEGTATDAKPIRVPISRMGVGAADLSKLETVNATYPIPGGVSIAAGSTASLTMVIDTNRMLRFENGGRDDRQKVFPDWSADRAYFFNSVFYESAFVFVGKPGAIKGYSWTATSCSLDDRPKATPSDYGCASNQSYQSFLVGGWLTIISLPDGSPSVLSFMPDDDDTLTVIKGNNLRTVGNGIEPDLSYFKTNTDGTTTLRYGLDEAVGSVTVELPSALGAKETGNFDGFQDNYGPFEIKREL